MTRNEMTAYLSEIDLRTTPTVITEDMGLQYDYITSKGAGTGFGGMGDWPIWRLPTLSTDKWEHIRSAIQNGTLTEEDITETGLDDIVEKAQQTSSCTAATILKNLLVLPAELEGNCYYCFFDGNQRFDDTTFIPEPIFYTDELKVKKAFIDEFVSSITTWDEMSDEDIEFWYNRTHDDLEQLTYYDYIDAET